MTLPAPPQFPIARGSAGPAPPRRPGSIRRTTSIDSEWPDGFGRSGMMTARARDLVTDFAGEAAELAAGAFHIRASPLRAIEEIDVTPAHLRASHLIGVRAGGASRSALVDALGDCRGSPLFQLLDDFSGASLVAKWIWPAWADDGLAPRDEGDAAARRRRMVNICTGFAEGASSLTGDGGIDAPSSVEVGSLIDPADPLGWHAMADAPGRPHARRARRIDIWRAEGVLKVDAGFQDSGSHPGGGRSAIHEYRVHAEIDEADGCLAALRILPLALPFRECPGAAIKAARMIGQPVAAFRQSTLEFLPGTLGCTHLNDVLRSFADIPLLAKSLPDAPR